MSEIWLRTSDTPEFIILVALGSSCVHMMKDLTVQFLQKPLMVSTSAIIFIISHLGIQALSFVHIDVQ